MSATKTKEKIDLQYYFSLTRITHAEKSQVEAIDAVTDCKDTMMQLLHNLQPQFIMGNNMRWLMLEGDAKLYEVVKCQKFDMKKNLLGYFICTTWTWGTQETLPHPVICWMTSQECYSHSQKQIFHMYLTNIHYRVMKLLVSTSKTYSYMSRT